MATDYEISGDYDDDDLDELGGEWDIAGDYDDDDDEVGGPRRRARKMARKLRRMRRRQSRLASRIASRVAQSAEVQASLGLAPQIPTGITTPYGNPVTATKRQVDASLYQVFGLGTQTLAAAGAGSLQKNFVERFKPGRLLLSEDLPGNTVEGIFIGVRPQTANIASMPIAAFAAGAFEVRVAFDVGEPGWPFTVNFATVAAATTVSGMAFGTTISG